MKLLFIYLLSFKNGFSFRSMVDDKDYNEYKHE